MEKVKENEKAWVCVCSDGYIYIGNREQMACYLNIFDDVYDDDVWDEIVELYQMKYVELTPDSECYKIKREKDLKREKQIEWKYINSDGKEVIGKREEIARELNIFDDVYDDDIWDEISDKFHIIYKDGNYVIPDSDDFISLFI